MITISWLILVIGGIISGILAGLLGIGGGIIIVPLLVTIGYTPVQSIATSSLAILITAISGSIQNWRMGYFDSKRVITLAIPALITAQAGVYLAIRLPSYLLLFLFGLFLLANIYLMQLKAKNTDSNTQENLRHNPLLARLLIGGSGGVLSGLFGLGGGAIMVPLQTLLLGERIKVAIQTSVGVIVGAAISSCIGHTVAGNILPIEGVILGLGGLIGAQLSTRLLPKLSEVLVRQIFRSFLAIFAVYSFWQSWLKTNPQTFLFTLGAIAVFLGAVLSALTIQRFLGSTTYEIPVASATQLWTKRNRQWIPLLLGLLIAQSLTLASVYRGNVSNAIGSMSSNFSSLAQNMNRPWGSECNVPSVGTKVNSSYVQICTAIRQFAKTKGAIGFGTQALTVPQRTIRPLAIAKGHSNHYISPITADGQINKTVLQNVSYPLLQRVFVIVRQDQSLDEVAGMAYANLLLSQTGQALVDRAGYLPIRFQHPARQ